MMSKTKRKKFEAKPKVIKVASYYSKQELRTIQAVADMLKVSLTQYIKGATMEMTGATLQMLRQQKEKADAEKTAAAEANETSGSEQPSDSTEPTVTISGPTGEAE